MTAARPIRSPAARSRPAAAPVAAPARRLTGAARRLAILREAAVFFAEHGFEASTRDLARKLGFTQALLYKFFPSKEALVAAVIEHALPNRGNSEREALLADRSLPLRERLIRFYQGMGALRNPTSIRLMVRAGLSGMGIAKRVSFRLTQRTLTPICRELRAERGLPDFSVMPLTRGERELAMTLHGGIVFIAIRKHVYGMDLPEDLDALVELHVDTFLTGAAATQRELLEERAPRSLAVPQLRP